MGTCLYTYWNRLLWPLPGYKWEYAVKHGRYVGHLYMPHMPNRTFRHRDSLSMDAFLNAIECFMAQYGDLTIAFYSDNGTNFRGADNALRKIYTKTFINAITTHGKFISILTPD